MTLPTTSFHQASTLLSAQLAPPPRPRFRGPTGGKVGAWTIIAGLTALTLLLWAATYPSNIAWGLFIAALVSAIAIPVVGTRSRRESEARFDSDLRWWAQLMEVWDQTYYCHQHDVVFLPDKHLVAPAADLISLLKAAAPRYMD